MEYKRDKLISTISKLLNKGEYCPAIYGYTPICYDTLGNADCPKDCTEYWVEFLSKIIKENQDGQN